MALIRKAWTDEDMSFIAATMDKPRHDISAEKGWTADQISHARRRIRNGAARKNERWTADEDEVIRAGRTLTSEALAERLPGRTATACKSRRIALRVPLIANHMELNPRNVAHRPLLAKTCPKCGLLLPAKWFGFTQKNKQWQSECRKCGSTRLKEDRGTGRHAESGRRRARAYYEKCQAITLPRATNHGNEYTEKDHAVLADPTKTTLVKALMLGRTYGSAHQQVIQHGYRSHKPVGDPERDIRIINNPNSDRADEITKQLTAALEAAPLTPEEREALWAWKD